MGEGVGPGIGAEGMQAVVGMEVPPVEAGKVAVGGVDTPLGEVGTPLGGEVDSPGGRGMISLGRRFCNHFCLSVCLFLA